MTCVESKCCPRPPQVTRDDTTVQDGLCASCFSNSRHSGKSIVEQCIWSQLSLCLFAMLAMTRTYYTDQVAELLGLSRRDLTRLLKKEVLEEPSGRNVYGYRQGTKTDIEQG